MTHDLTDAEITAIRTCLNYGDRASQLSDNFSNGGMVEFMDALGWNRNQVAALIGSLEKKGMGWSDDNDGNGHIFWLSEKAVNIIFDIMEEER